MIATESEDHDVKYGPIVSQTHRKRYCTGSPAVEIAPPVSNRILSVSGPPAESTSDGARGTETEPPRPVRHIITANVGPHSETIGPFAVWLRTLNET
jgi:hypothetical protein